MKIFFKIFVDAPSCLEKIQLPTLNIGMQGGHLLEQ